MRWDQGGTSYKNVYFLNTRDSHMRSGTALKSA